LKIGELAKLSGCSIQAIRYYEKEKLLDSIKRSEGGYRLYDNRAIRQLMFIKHCRNLDITLSEIRLLIELRDYPETTCGNVNALIDKHSKQVDLRIKELTALKRQLETLRQTCTSGRAIKDCGILMELSQ